MSSAGGESPRWRGDGKELFYLAPGDVLMSVTLRMNTEIEADAPQRLFDAARLTGRPDGRFEVTRDGQRFLLNKVIDQRSADVPSP